MRKHFAFDIDDTFTQSEKLYDVYLKEYLHTDNPLLIKAFYKLPWSEQKPFFAQYTEQMIPNYELQENASEVLKRLKKRDYTLSAISLRGHNIPVDEALTFDYLKKHNIPVDNIILRCKKKMEACKRIGASYMADDSYWMIEQFKGSGIRPLHFSEKVFDVEDSEVITVSNWLEIEEYLMKEEEMNEHSKYYVKK